MASTEAPRKPETMGRRLASIRVLRGMSQEQAATEVGFTQPYLSQLETDKTASPPIDTIAALAKLYGVTIDYLVYGEAA